MVRREASGLLAGIEFLFDHQPPDRIALSLKKARRTFILIIFSTGAGQSSTPRSEETVTSGEGRFNDLCQEVTSQLRSRSARQG